jgi:hypothetical protein
MQISAIEFKGQQAQLMRSGKPEDPCGDCGCRRDSHLPKKTFSYAKSGGSSGKSIEVAVLAPTSCDCKYCICYCTGFVEPFDNQKHQCCVYAREATRAEKAKQWIAQAKAEA